jgi:hydrogenase maturation factor
METGSDAMIELQARPASLAGSLRFIRYAFMPNHLRYCGGDDNRTLLEYGTEGTVDGGLQPLLRRFTGALPYLQLIARANGITNPFDERVVEAYWIGNPLLETVEVRQLHDALAERFGKQLRGKTREWVLGKAPAGARPHHNTLATMDGCRVAWGRVVAVHGPELRVERQPLHLIDGKLALGPAETVTALRQIDGRGFADDAQPGDWVTLHWGWVCETITAQQQRALEHYTRYHLALANQTI